MGLPTTMRLPSLNETQKLAEMLASRIGCGDVVTLAGDLGAGKTSFAQFFIHALSNEGVEVTSPTFTLLQTYPVILPDGNPQELYHYDLYRIEHPSQLIELGLEEAFEHVTLIEWPERASGVSVPVALALSFAFENDGRTVTIQGDPKFLEVISL